MRASTLLAAAVLVLATPACDRGGKLGPTGPRTASVSLVYVPSAPASCSAPGVRECSGSCAHHYAPSNLQASGSWGEDARLQACGDAYCATLPSAPVGRKLTVLLIDIAQCCRDCTAAARETVYANGTRLARFISDPGQLGGLAFEIDARGVVTP